MYGYHGKILHIDLTNRKIWTEEKPEDWYKVYIGGVSMASRLAWENIEPGSRTPFHQQTRSSQTGSLLARRSL